MARRIRAYTVAVAAALAAFLITHVMWPVIEPTRSPLFLAAIVVSAWHGGLGPGLVTTAIAVLTKMYFLMPPSGLQVDDVADVLYLAVFVLVALLVSSLTGALRRVNTANHELVLRERAARAEAEAANRAKDVFLAKISHELRTPLQATSSWAHLLGRARHDDHVFTDALAALHRGIAAQSHLIDELLGASQIIAGKMRLDVEPVMLGPVIDAAVRTAKAAAPLPQPAVHVVVDPSVGPVPGDRARLEQIVCNLLSNALKFTPPQGRVDVRLESADATVRIVVEDTGRGIPREMLSRLFDEFWQARTEASGSPVGLGLGLAIVRQLVHMHRGTVDAESAGPGSGATFVVKLPFARHDDQARVVPAAGEARREASQCLARTSSPAAHQELS
jgi:signal transduction histidine kinase